MRPVNMCWCRKEAIRRTGYVGEGLPEPEGIGNELELREREIGRSGV